MSIAQEHLKGKDKYELHGNIVVYFCFPTLGVAVPLRRGDFLLFNALIPHCILSRCKQTNNIYCVSMYLKSAIVGMNNNLMPLTTKQAILSKRYQKSKNIFKITCVYPMALTFRVSADMLYCY
jgi:hypothetical protein